VKRLRRSLSVFWLVGFLWLSAAKLVSAQTPPTIAPTEPFTVAIDTQVTLSDQAPPQVQHAYHITNRAPTQYIKQFALHLPFPNVHDIKVTSSAQKPLAFDLQPESNAMGIRVTFDQPVIGAEKVTHFFVSYPLSESFVNTGHAKHFRWPAQQNSTSQRHTLRVVAPNSWGEPHLLTPNTTTAASGSATLVNTSDVSQPTSVLFGEQQAYSFQLRYTLATQSTSTSETQVTLPPDTATQTITLTDLDPAPTTISTDRDGNWIATYLLEGERQQTILINGQALVHAEPQRPDQAPTAAHAQPQPWWEAPPNLTRQMVEQLTTPKAIYDWTSSLPFEAAELAPRTETWPRLVEQKPVSSDHIADAYLTVMRAKHWPSRRIVGATWSAPNTTQWHTWVDEYDAELQQWLAHDPAFAHASGGLDYWSHVGLDHVALTINGASSSLPFAPREHPFGLTTPAAVAIQPSQPLTTEDQPPTLELRRSPNYLWPLSNLYELVVTNPNGHALHHLPVTITPENGGHVSLQQSSVTVLPFQKSIVPFWVRGQLPSQRLRLTLTLANVSSTQDVEFTLWTTANLPFLFVSLGVGGCVAVCAGVAGSVLVYRAKQRRALRRKSQKSQKSDE
jgi:hypothetical protein